MTTIPELTAKHRQEKIDLVSEVLEDTNYNATRAARILDISTAATLKYVEKVPKLAAKYRKHNGGVGRPGGGE